MATVQRRFLSASTTGDPIKVVATATAGTTIHTAQASTAIGDMDLVTLYVSNTSASAVVITVEWGGVTDPDHLICKLVSVPANSGPTLLIEGLPLNSANVVGAFAASANVLLITGFVDRVS